MPTGKGSVLRGRATHSINRLIISLSSHDAPVHLNYKLNSIPDNGRTTCVIRAGIVPDD